MKIILTLFLTVSAALQVNAQLYQGPAAGSVASGVMVTTDNFTDEQHLYPQSPLIVKGTQNELLPELPPYRNSVAPTGPEGSNKVYDTGALTGEGDSPSILLRNFPGVPRTNFIPPDPTIAAGPTHIMGGVNSTFRIWDKQGNVLKTISGSTWYASLGLGIGGTISDPKIIYDHYAKRWIISWITPPIGPRAYDVISVSDDSIPLGTWYNYAMRTDLNGNTPEDLWRDYQGVGYDANAIYITGNGFTLSSSSFRYSTIRIINKAQLYANTGGPVNWFDMWDIRDASNQGTNFGIRPSIIYGNPNEYYFLCNSNSGGTYVSLYKLVNPLANPSMSGVAVPVIQYSSPPPSGQLGSTATITSGGSSAFRNEPVYRNGFLYAVHAVRFESSFSGFKYYKFNLSTNTAIQDVTFGAPQFFYSYPALSVDKYENIVVSFSRSATTEYIGAGYTTRTFSDPPTFFNPSSLLQPGKGTYVNTGQSNRWGDYMGSWLDPANEEDFWIMTEYADLQNLWGVWVGNLRVAPYLPARIFSNRDTLKFGNVEVGAVSDTQKVVIRNYGNQNLSISSIQSSNSVFRFVSVPPYPIILPFNDSLVLKALFVPSQAGSRVDSIRFSSNDPVAPDYYMGVRGKGYVISPVQANTIYAVTGAQSSGSLLKINSATGIAELVGQSGLSQLNGMSIRPSNNQIYATVTSSPSTLLYRVNAAQGDAYSTVSIPAPNIRAIAFDLNDDLYCATVDGKLYRYYFSSGDTDFVGSTGVQSLFGLSINPVNRTLWAISATGGVYKVNKQTAASQLVGNTNNSPNTDIAFSKNGALFCVSGVSATLNKLLQLDTSTAAGSVIGTNTGFSGISGIALSPEIVGIQQIGTEIPSVFFLKQNYPNPFNPATTIEFDVVSSARTSLRVYDVLGRTVRVLVNEFMPAGKYEYTFDASGMESGVYYYELISGSFREVKRMVLLK